MARLRVVIDRHAETASFSGPGTFSAKEGIKSLGSARWVSAEKTWVVSEFRLPVERLEELFPGVVVEEASPATPEQPSKAADSPAAANQGLSVSQFLMRVQAVLTEAFPSVVCVYGCLNQVRRVGRRVFLELADEEDRREYVDCVIWDDEESLCKKLIEAGFTLETDLQVMFLARVGLHRRGSRLSLTVVGVVAEYTLQKLAAERDKTNQRLREEGFFELNKQKRLPFLPRRLGLLTSAGGTVIHDFQSSLDHARFGFHLLWLPVTVQGREAASQIARGIARLNEESGLDAILVFRGGGSPSELAVFNDYEVAKAVCLSRLPVLSAIGHQEDQCSVQDVSFLAFGVPKDLGRFFADLVLDLRERFHRSVDEMGTCLNAAVRESDERLGSQVRGLGHLVAEFARGRALLLRRLSRGVPVMASGLVSRERAYLFRFIGVLHHQLFRPHEMAGHRLRHEMKLLGRGVIHQAERASRGLSARTEMLYERALQVLLSANVSLAALRPMAREVARAIGEKGLKLEGLERLFESASPRIQLERGFALLRKKGEEKITRRAADLSVGDRLEIELFDGKRPAEILEGREK